MDLGTGNQLQIIITTTRDIDDNDAYNQPHSLYFLQFLEILLLGVGFQEKQE